MEYKKYQLVVLQVLLLAIITIETLFIYNSLKEAQEEYEQEQNKYTVSL